MKDKKEIGRVIFNSFVDLAISFAFTERSKVPMDEWMNKPFYEKKQVTEDIECEVVSSSIPKEHST